MEFLSSIGIYALSALVFLIIFSLLIILHEFGHFWAARKAGVKVLEFGFGLPPKIWSKKTNPTVVYEDENGKKIERKEEMEWTINAIPFGGFVRMLGEDEKSNAYNSFGQRPLLWRIIIVCGGVVMNFLLGWFILSIALTMGMNPLIPSEEKKDELMAKGVLEEQKDVLHFANVAGTIAEELGLKNQDRVISVNDHLINSPESMVLFYNDALQKQQDITIVVERFSLPDYKWQEQEIFIPKKTEKFFAIPISKITIQEVLPDSPAFAMGLKKGDVIQKMGGSEVHSIEQFQGTIEHRHENGIKTLRLGIERDGAEKLYMITLNDKGKIGIVLESEVSMDDENEAELQVRDFYYPVKKLQYPWYEAPKIAFIESFFWMEKSLEMIGDLVKKVFGSLSLPEGIGGPVAIAHTTHLLTELGDVSKILQFTAILSLSLAVVNIMPFPGLDGGRLIFLLFEGILLVLAFFAGLLGFKKFPRKVPDSWEIPFHFLGYFLLLALIVWISWNDIVRIFF